MYFFSDARTWIFTWKKLCGSTIIYNLCSSIYNVHSRAKLTWQNQNPIFGHKKQRLDDVRTLPKQNLSAWCHVVTQNFLHFTFFPKFSDVENGGKRPFDVENAVFDTKNAVFDLRTVSIISVWCRTSPYRVEPLRTESSLSVPSRSTPYRVEPLRTVSKCKNEWSWVLDIAISVLNSEKSILDNWFGHSRSNWCTSLQMLCTLELN